MRLRLRLTDWQLAVLARMQRPLDELVATAVAHDVEPRRRPAAPRAADHAGVVVEPGTGIGAVLALGETITIEQIVDGQCADLNAFALTDPPRPFSAARTRMLHGLHPTAGAVLWSAPPEVPLLEIVADTAGDHDLAFPMCTEAEYGLPGHPSCFGIQRDIQSRWGVTPHDPLNLWLPSEVLPDGTMRSWPVACRRGDYIELEAKTDVLVTVNPCPDDLFGSSQYEPGPVRVVLSSPPVIAGEPLPAPHEVEVELPEELEPHVAEVRESGWLGFTDAAVVRALLFRWWEAAQSAGSTHTADHGQPTSQRSPGESE